MNFVDVIFFQATIAPDKLALIAHGSVIPYSRFWHGVLSAQQRLVAIGVTEGQTVALNIGHPIDHLVMAAALYRMKVASATVNGAIDTYLDRVPFDLVLSDAIAPAVAAKQPNAKFVLVDPKWFQDQITFSIAQRMSSRRDPADWVCRITCYPDGTALPPIVRTTSRALEGQLLSYTLGAPPDWDRMISMAGLYSAAGFLHAISALWLGRTVCFADAKTIRTITVTHKHHYLVAQAADAEPLLRLQETDFIPLHCLRAACLEGQSAGASMRERARATICSNLQVRYSHPEVGIVAYGDASRLQGIEGAMGYVAPWADLQIVDSQGAPVAPDKEGTLRLRPSRRLLPGMARSDTDVSRAAEPDDGWIYPGQRARLTPDNLLVITGAAA